MDENNTSSVSDLLSETAKIADRHKQDLESEAQRGESFNVFRLCGIAHYEVWHSKILAEFLNPNGSHGQGCAFLHEFFRMMDIGWDPVGAHVYTEVPSRIGGESFGRLDILIDGNDYGIVIENKLFAAEQHEQLFRYAEWLKDRYGNDQQGRKRWRLLFLTPNGREGKTDIKKDADRLAYVADPASKSVCSWLDVCQRIAVNAPFVRETIAQYGVHIKNIIGGVGMANVGVVKVLENSPAAAQLVFEGYKDAVKNIIETFLREFLDENAEFNGWKKVEARLQHSFDSANSGLDVTYKRSENQVQISFYFEAKGYRSLFVGVSKDNLPDKFKDVKDWPERIKAYNQNFESDRKWWPIWKYVVVEGLSDWDGAFLQKLQDDHFKNRVKVVLKECLCNILTFFEAEQTEVSR